MLFKLTTVMLLVVVCAAQGAPEKKTCEATCPVNTPRLLCIDAMKPATPRPLTVAGSEPVEIRVINKPPFATVKIDLAATQLPDPTDAALSKAFSYLASIAFALPVAKPSAEGEGKTQRKTLDEPDFGSASGLPSPYTTQFQTLINVQTSDWKDIHDAYAARRDGADSVGEVTGLEAKDLGCGENDKDGVKELTEKINTVLGKLAAIKMRPGLVSPAGSAALLARLFDEFKRASLPGDGLDNVTRQLAKARAAQDAIEAEYEKLKTATDALQTASDGIGKFLKAMAKTPLFVISRPYRYDDQYNAKGPISITLSGEAAKPLASVDITWATPPRVTLSFGVGISTLKRQSFSNQAIPKDIANLDTTTFTNQIAGTASSLTVLPMGLLHVRLKRWGKLKCDVAFSVGGGFNPKGDTPTGEAATGFSFGVRNFYLSPLLHFGRQTQLQPGYTVKQKVTDKYTPLTHDVWTPAFGFAITYRLPL